MCRKDLSHKNTYGLSRRSCASEQCRYCVELKDAAKQENSVRRIVLIEENFEEWQREQLEDP